MENLSVENLLTGDLERYPDNTDAAKPREKYLPGT